MTIETAIWALLEEGKSMFTFGVGTLAPLG
jgi:hypothetical protein